MKKWFFCLLALLMITSCALAQDLVLQAGDGDVKISLTTGDQFVFLTWKSPQERGQTLLYSDDGTFEHTIPLKHSYKGGTVNVTVQNTSLKNIAKGFVNLPADTDCALPAGTGDARVSNFVIEPTFDGFRYSFCAPGADYMMLKCHSRQEDFSIFVYPDDAAGNFSGTVIMPLTYPCTQITATVCSGNGHSRREAICFKGYEVSEAAASVPGPLSGVVVCIDPGHQEISKSVREPRGPGLQGEATTISGMAWGHTTLRRESIVVLEIGMRLRDLLLSQGAEVVMTRTQQDIYVSNIERCNIANQGGAHIMLRLHCNTSGKAEKFGIQIYSPRSSDYAKAVADEATYTQMGQLLLDQIKQAVGYDLIEHTGRVKLTNDYIGNNWAQMPCFLVEMGYMSNTREDLLLSHPVYQQWLAEGMMAGVKEIALMRGIISE